MSFPNRVLLTGAAGIVGQAMRPLLREKVESLFVSDIAPVDGLAENESYIQCDLSDFDAVSDSMKGVDGIFHLGGMVGSGFDHDLNVSANIIGTRNIFEAARLSGISRIVFASSHHVVGFTPRGKAVDHLAPLRPNTDYAVAKVYGEGLASYYADNYAIDTLSIRIGYVGNDLSKERRLRTWISPRDLLQLVEIGFTYPELGHEIVYGISDTPEPRFFDNRNAHRLGYRPKDRSVDQDTAVVALDASPDLSTIEEGVVGGGFANAGFEGDPKRVLEKK